MFTTTLPRLLAAVSLACALTACGANVDTTATAATPVLAASATHMPVADCEPQACQGLRIIDSNAETFRADNARREALAQAVDKMDRTAAN
jgi:hypothetical protein